VVAHIYCFYILPALWLNILAQQDNIKDSGCWLKSGFRKTTIDTGLGYEVKYRTSLPKLIAKFDKTL